MMDETRINDLVEIFRELAEVSGGYEETKIYTNLEVINASPANLPAGYIIIKDSEDYHIPALKVAGLTYANGDLVNVLFIKGTEPIAFQQGSGSSAVGYAVNISDEGVDQGVASTLDFAGANVSVAVAAGVATITVAAGGWGFDHIWRVSLTNADADYSDIQDAIDNAATVAGDIILLDPDYYELTSTLAINKAITVMCLDPYGATLSFGDSNNATVSITGAGAKLVNVSVIHTGAIMLGQGIRVAANGVVLENCIGQSSGTPDTGYGIFVDSGTGVEIRNCQGYSTGASSLSAGLGIDLGAEAVVYSGTFSGDDADIYINSTATGELRNLPTLANNRFTNSGTAKGEFQDNAGNMVFVGSSILKGVASNFPNLGTTTAAEKMGSVYQAPAKDIFPDADVKGLAGRWVWPFTVGTYTDHFRSGSIPTGYAWLNSGNLNGVAAGVPSTVLSYNLGGDWLWAGPESGKRAFLYKSATNDPIGKAISGVFQTGATAAVGLRIDKNDDASYIEFYLEEQNNGMCRWRYVSDGALTSGTVDFPACFPYALSILLYNAGATMTAILYMYGWGSGYPSMQISVTGLTKWGSVTHRSGIITRNPLTAGMCDVFYNQVA